MQFVVVLVAFTCSWCFENLSFQQNLMIIKFLMFLQSSEFCPEIHGSDFLFFYNALGIRVGFGFSEKFWKFLLMISLFI